jgi:hypothetical protein
MENYKFFLQDFIKIFFEEINGLIKEEKNDFIKGQLFGYYNILTILKQQADIFEINSEELGIEKIDENKLLFCKDNNKHNIIKTMIDKWDPYGLLAGGASDDEFNNEIKKIADKINSNSSINDIANIISNIFSNSFDDNSFSVENCMEVAKKIKRKII